MQLPKLLKKPEEEKKEKKQEDPMEDSEYCLTQTIGKALVGFAKALELRQGKLHLVTTQDILEYSDVDGKEFEFLFGDAYGLLEATEELLYTTFTEDIKLLEGLNRTDQLTCILMRLKKDTPMLTTLRLLGDHTVWKKALRTVYKSWTENWPALSNDIGEYIYRIFCCQFVSVLEKWEEAEFKKELIPICVQLIVEWLEADASMAIHIQNASGLTPLEKTA